MISLCLSVLCCVRINASCMLHIYSSLWNKCVYINVSYLWNCDATRCATISLLRLDSPIWSKPPLWDSSITHSDKSHCIDLLWTSDQPVAETSTWQHTTFKRIKYPCSRRDSNPQSQQASGRRPTHYTARPPGSTYVIIYPLIIVYAEHLHKNYQFN
jgi:hypothetical protein